MYNIFGVLTVFILFLSPITVTSHNALQRTALSYVVSVFAVVNVLFNVDMVIVSTYSSSHCATRQFLRPNSWLYLSKCKLFLIIISKSLIQEHLAQECLLQSNFLFINITFVH